MHSVPEDGGLESAELKGGAGVANSGQMGPTLGRPSVSRAGGGQEGKGTERRWEREWGLQEQGVGWGHTSEGWGSWSQRDSSLGSTPPPPVGTQGLPHAHWIGGSACVGPPNLDRAAGGSAWAAAEEACKAQLVCGMFKPRMTMPIVN